MRQSSSPGFPYLLLSTRVPFPNKISCSVSTCVSLDNSFLSVRQEPSFGPWKGSPFLQQKEWDWGAVSSGGWGDASEGVTYDMGSGGWGETGLVDFWGRAFPAEGTVGAKALRLEISGLEKEQFQSGQSGWTRGGVGGWAERLGVQSMVGGVMGYVMGTTERYWAEAWLGRGVSGGGGGGDAVCVCVCVCVCDVHAIFYSGKICITENLPF